jgi:hypothetical protein
MQLKLGLLSIAVLALISGTVFAAPMLITPLDIKPFPHFAEGPKADFDISIVYANFSVAQWEQNQTVKQLVNNPTYGNLTYEYVNKTFKYSNVTYFIVANVTNLSDITAKMYESSFVAAEDISITDSVLGGRYFTNGKFDQGKSFGAIVEGIYLDGQWLNETWIAGTNYPMNLFQIMNQKHISQTKIPTLPENASETGTWIEGVPVAEYYEKTGLTATQIYINGAWVDVTGRVQPSIPQPMVMANNTFADLILSSGTPIYRNVGNASAGPVTHFPSWNLEITTGIPYRYAGLNGFNSYWDPHESKLIVFSGTSTYVDSETTENIITALESGKIDLYGSYTSLITNKPIDGTFYNTFSTATWLNSVPIERTDNGYLYNAILADNQVFQILPNGIEVLIQ